MIEKELILMINTIVIGFNPTIDRNSSLVKVVSIPYCTLSLGKRYPIFFAILDQTFPFNLIHLAPVFISQSTFTAAGNPIPSKILPKCRLTF
jgi:hypothetical protein